MPRAAAAKTKEPRKPEFSPTKLRNFLTCPMMYRLEYIERIGRFYHKARSGFTFGSVLHQTLQNFHETGGPAAVSANELVISLDSQWRSQGYADAIEEQKHKDEAVRILQSYHSISETRIETTRTFLTEKTLKWDMGLFVLTGRIDRIDEHVADGALEIVDYKSGRRTVEEADVKSALAMSVYQLLVKRNYPDRRVFATIHALRGDVTASATYTDEELAELETEIRGVGIMILEQDFEAVRPIRIETVCPDCDFFPVCNRYFRQQEREERWD